MTHTPGPWVNIGNAIVAPNSPDTYGMDNRDFWETFGHEPEPTVVVSLISAMGGNDTVADANLIAAAPDLLEVAKMLASLESADGGRSFPTREMAAAARAAIAKAVPQ